MSASLIHPTAIVSPRAQLDSSVSIGPFCMVGDHVRIDANTRLAAHVIIEGHTQIGRNNQFHANTVIGGPPQDKKYAGEPTRLEIGDNNTFREAVTVNCGTAQDTGVTTIGSDNWIMAYVHIAHDCVVGDQTILANCTQLAGHVQIGDWAILGGFTGIHQFCKVGAHAMAGVGSVVLHDIPPFVMVSGNSASAHGINTEGLKRRGFSAQAIGQLRAAYKTIYKSGLSLEQARASLHEQHTVLAQSDVAEHIEASQSVAQLLDFLTKVTRGIVR